MGQVSSAKPGDSSTKNSVFIEFDQVEKVSDEPLMFYTPPIETLADNPVVAMGLISGADAINRSVESLLDSVFYGLMDNQRIFPMNDDTWVQVGLRRKVFSTSSGNYVIFDRFQMGPESVREISRFNNIPIKIGFDANSEFLQIYLRSDGLRVHESDYLPFWRRAVNQWFGLLPLLSAVLPPSFNSNELYDPLKQASTPFSFPFNKRGFHAMPIGSIRSYAISGGARIFADIGVRLPQEIKEQLSKIGQFSLTNPYSIFVRGEHRINVLRRGENIAWVGIKNLKRTGHILSTSISRQFNLFKGLLSIKFDRWNWVWQGRPVLFLPFDMALEQALGVFFDQVYEFDLSKSQGLEAYEFAVRGDFVPAQTYYKQMKERGLQNGVVFQFSRQQTRRDVRAENGPNIAFFNSRRSSEQALSKIEITDQRGKFHVLEAAHDLRDRTWNVLVGEKEKRVQQTVELQVKKASKPNEKNLNSFFKADTYVYEPNLEPYRLSILFTVQDRNVVASDLLNYLRQLQDISDLRMHGLPVINKRDPRIEEEYRRKRFFAGPDVLPVTLHVMPPFLGRFSAQLLLSFSSQSLSRILKRSESEIWQVFAKCFGFAPTIWTTEGARSEWAQKLWWLGSVMAFPLRLFNIRFESIDAFRETQYIVSAINALKQESDPSASLEGFGRLLDTSYPEILVKGLLMLAGSDSVSRRLVLSTQAKGRASQRERDAFSKMDRMVFSGGPSIPPPSRYTGAKEKLAGFYLEQPQSGKSLPEIVRIDVSAVEVPTTLLLLKNGSEDMLSDVSELGVNQRQIQMTMGVKGGLRSLPIKIFVKFEEAGRLKIGKFELAEKVFEVLPVPSDERSPGVSYYDVYLTGPLSPLNGYLLQRSLQQGGDFRVTASVSIDGVEWGDSRSFEFRFENGRLLPFE